MPQSAAISPTLLTKAVFRAAEQLELSADLPSLLEIPSAEVAELQSGTRVLDPQSKEWSNAAQVVSLFRTLVSLVGTVEQARAWLGNHNDALDARPVDLLRTPAADRVYRYLDAMLKNELRMPQRPREH